MSTSQPCFPNTKNYMSQPSKACATLYTLQKSPR
jgi:hypothetical protein